MPLEWLTSQMILGSPLLGSTAQWVFLSSLMSVSSTSPPCGKTRIEGSQMSSSSGMRTVARMTPSDPSSA